MFRLTRVIVRFCSEPFGFSTIVEVPVDYYWRTTQIPTNKRLLRILLHRSTSDGMKLNWMSALSFDWQVTPFGIMLSYDRLLLASTTGYSFQRPQVNPFSVHDKLLLSVSEDEWIPQPVWTVFYSDPQLQHPLCHWLAWRVVAVIGRCELLLETVMWWPV
jgi:hypothetical protein